jgi:hypothetical protein
MSTQPRSEEQNRRKIRNRPKREMFVYQPRARLFASAVESITPEEAPEYFGWMAHLVTIDLAASSALTRQQLGWNPTGAGPCCRPSAHGPATAGQAGVLCSRCMHNGNPASAGRPWRIGAQNEGEEKSRRSVQILVVANEVSPKYHKPKFILVGRNIRRYVC